jgi:hypothetical protein
MLMTLTLTSRLASPINGVALGLDLVAVLALWWLTRPLPAVRRASLRLTASMMLGGLIQAVYLVWPQHPDVVFRMTAGLEVLIGLAMLWTLPYLDARVRRTLALEGAVAR